MEKKNGVIGYLSQVFIIYGITALLLTVFCMVFGAEAKDLSTMFALGGQGVPVSTMLEFLLAIALIVALRKIFMTDMLFKNMSLVWRMIAMFAGCLAVTAAFIIVCGWFPVTDVQAWIMFFGCFAISCFISTMISVLAERQENKKFEEALRRFKGEA